MIGSGRHTGRALVRGRRGIAATALLAVALAVATDARAKGTGYLFVSSEKDHTVTVLDGKSYQVVKQIRTAARPRHMAFDPQRTRLYVACGDGDAIDIIDVNELALVDRIVGIEDPEAFGFSPDGKTMYLSLEDDAKLGILDLDAYFAARGGTPELTVAEVSEGGAEGERSGEERKNEEGARASDSDGAVPGLRTIEVGEEPEGILVSPDGATVFVTSEVANMVHVVDTASGTLKANVVVGNRPRRLALTPDGKELWVTSELAGSVSILDMGSYQVKRGIEFRPKGFRPEDVTPVGITMTADGATAWVALGRANHVAVVDVASGDILDYVLVGNRAWNVTFNRDESLLFVANGLSDDVSIIDAAKRRVIRSVPVGRVPYAVLVDD